MLRSVRFINPFQKGALKGFIGVHALLSQERTWELSAVALPPRLIYVVPVLVINPPRHFGTLRRKSQISLIKIKKSKCNEPPKKINDGAKFQRRSAS
jgi:hypothetical protein